MTKSTKESSRVSDTNQPDPEVIRFRAEFDQRSPLGELVRDRVMAKYLKPDLLILDDMGMK